MKKCVLITTFATIIVACNIDDLDFDNIEIPLNTVFAFNLGEITYNLGDIIDKQTGDTLDLQEDSSTSLLTLFYHDTISYNVSDDFIQIGDINVGDTITIPPATGPIAVNLNQSFEFQYDPDDEEQMDSLFYMNGELSITTNSNINGNVSYTYTILNTVNIRNNVPVSISGTINGRGSDTPPAISLVDHKTFLTNSSDDNSFTVTLDFTITLNAMQSIVANDFISFDLTYRNQTFNLIYGKFGQDTVRVGDQSIEIDFFSQVAREGIKFGNPSMAFEFRNSFGIPMALDFSGLAGEGENGENRVSLTGSIVRNPPVIEGSDINSPGPGIPGEVARSMIEINRSNSNLVNLLSSSPKNLVFNVNGRSNPANLSALNYVQPSSEFIAYVTMEFPMEVQLEGLQESGTFSLDGGLDFEERVDSAFVRVLTINELPFSAIASLEIQDVDSMTLHSITDNLIINAPFINLNGEVTDPNGATTDILLSEEGIEALMNASHVLITLTLNTPVSQTSREIYVKLFADYSLIIKVGLGVKFNQVY